MIDVLTMQVVAALTDLGFERTTTNESYALYAHQAGASVSLPHTQDRVSDGLLKAIERQVTGFGIASSKVFWDKVRASPIPPMNRLDARPFGSSDNVSGIKKLRNAK